MSEATIQVYDDSLMALLEDIWGEGFMSPRGTAEVDPYLDGADIRHVSNVSKWEEIYKPGSNRSWELNFSSMELWSGTI